MKLSSADLPYMSDQQKKWLFQMRSLLHHNVPRFIVHILKRGGVSDNEWQWIQREDEEPDCLAGLIFRADEYLLYPKNQKTFEQSLFVLVKGLAIMSFIPGGIRIFGLRFCSQVEDFVEMEEDFEPKA